MFGALKRGFRGMAKSNTCKECCWRTSTEKNTCGIARFPCGSTAFLYYTLAAISRIADLYYVRAVSASAVKHNAGRDAVFNATLNANIIKVNS